LSEYHLLGALLEPSLPSRVEREEKVKHIPFTGGLGELELPTSFTPRKNHTPRPVFVSRCPQEEGRQ
jgi:hypothetical protein